MLVYPHKPGSMYILTRNQTVLDALSVPLWGTYLMLFLVLFIEVEFAVQRRRKKNSNANFSKLSFEMDPHLYFNHPAHNSSIKPPLSMNLLDRI